MLGDQSGLFNWLLIIDYPWPAGLAPAGDDCVITACWWQDGVRRADSIRIGAVLEKWEDGGRQAGAGSAGLTTASELSQIKIFF